MNSSLPKLKKVVASSFISHFARTTLLLLTATLLLSCSQGAVKNVKPFSFAYLSDLHIAEGSTSIDDLKATVADINDLVANFEASNTVVSNINSNRANTTPNQNKIEFVIIAGDVTELGSDKEIAIAHTLLEELTVPYYIVAGNHESKWSESGCQTFAKVFGGDCFHFTHNGVHFLGTNSGPDMRMMPGWVPIKSIKWLDSVTTTIPRNAPVIFVNHYPLDESLLNYKKVISLLERTNLQLVMVGHGHQDRELQFGAIPAMMGRSNLSSGRDAQGVPGYNIITVSGDTFSATTKAVGKSEEQWLTIALRQRADNLAVSQQENDLAVSQQENDLVASQQGNDLAVSHNKTSIVEQLKASAPQEIWSFYDEGEILSAPAWGAAHALYATTLGSVKCLNGENGELLWEFKGDNPIYSSPAIDDNSLTAIFGSTNHTIYGLNLETGEVKWRIEADKAVLGSPRLFNGVAYIGSSDGIFRAIEAATGKLLWSYDGVEGFVETLPWVDESGVYFGDWANKIYALNVADGSLRWIWSNNRWDRASDGSAIAASDGSAIAASDGSLTGAETVRSIRGRVYSPAAAWPVKVGNRLFVVTPERRLYAINTDSGKTIWSHYGGRESLGISEDGTTIYVKGMQDTLYAFNSGAAPCSAVPSLGALMSAPPVSSLVSAPSVSSLVSAPSLKWSSEVGFGYELAPSAITSAYGVTFIPTDKGKIYGVNAFNGELLWERNFSEGLINYIRPVGEGRILITSLDGKVALMLHE